MRPVTTHPATVHPDLLIGVADTDDAGVYSLGDGRALIQTVDIFTPVVDDAYDWGRIAAANALSDVYAMGGRPLTALDYLAWPRDVLPFDLASEVLRGGFDVMAQANCVVIGGHSIDGQEPAFGFAVTGIANAGDIVSIAGARPGDYLILTKPLGIGIVTTAIKRGICPEDVAAAAIEQMVSINDVAGHALVEFDAHAATDVTGFGLIGHLREMCEASGVGAELDFAIVPVADGARELLEQGAWPSGSQRNLESVGDIVDQQVSDFDLKVLADAQTSGGLLVALDPSSADSYVGSVPGAAAIGMITDGGVIVVR